MAEDTVGDLFSWQIGSKKPPKVCLCCGQPFSEERTIRGPYRGSPYIWVCEICWGRPELFFPDKNQEWEEDYTAKARRKRTKPRASRESPPSAESS